MITPGCLNIRGVKLGNIKAYLIALVTTLITTSIITRKQTIMHVKGKEILLYGFDGLMMEIPQRLMMQSFVYGMLKLLGVSSLIGYTIIATAIIWCMCIIVQSFLFRMPLHKDMLFDLLASFVFSLGIGYVYQVTGLIIISMIAHFCERIVSCYILSRKHDTSI